MADTGRRPDASDQPLYGPRHRNPDDQAEIERKMIHCVLFDLDGTLIDTWNLYVRTMERTLKEICSEEIPADQLATLRLNSEPRLLGYFVPPDEVGSAHQRFLANYHTLHEACFGGVYPGVLTLLTSLQNRGIRTGIVTGKSRGAWEITRQHVRLGEFDTLVCDEDVSTPKPDCEGLVKAMKNLGVSPSESIYVGDSKDDLEAATTAGGGFLAARWSKTEAEISSFDKAAAEIGPYTAVDYPGEIDQFLDDLQ